jgi:hypothetical protein
MHRSEVRIMANYFYKWMPLVVLGSIFLLALPWLGLIALLVVVFLLVGALATLALAVARAVGTVGRAIGRPWHGPSTVEERGT